MQVQRPARAGAIAAGLVLVVLAIVLLATRPWAGSDDGTTPVAGSTTGSPSTAPADSAGPTTAAPDHTGSDPATTGPGASSPASQPTGAAATLCPVSAQQVTSLLGTSRSAAAHLEALRDGVPLLHERIDGLLDGDADPASQQLVRRLQSIEAHWRDALSAHDAGNSRQADDALAAADKAIGRLTGDLAALGVARGDCSS